MSELITVYFPYIVIAVFLIVAAVYDIIGGMIPMHLFPCLFGMFFPLVILSDNFSLLRSLAGLFLGVFCFYIMARLFDGGGGDILMMAVLGWCLGIKGLIYIILLSCGCYLVFFLVMLCVRIFSKKNVREILREQYPYAPFVLVGYIICCLLGWLI